jgi:hypothetical protein
VKVECVGSGSPFECCPTPKSTQVL